MEELRGQKNKQGQKSQGDTTEKLRGEILEILQDYRKKCEAVSKEGRTEHTRKEAEKLAREVRQVYTMSKKAPSHYLPEIFQILTARRETIGKLWEQFRAEINSRKS